MKNRTAKLVVVAVLVVAVLVVAFVAGVMSSTLSGDSGTTHTMHDGSTMDGGGMP